MTPEQLVIGGIRIFGSLLVFRWLFVGAVIAIIVDFSDLFWMGWLDLGGLGNYQEFDKWLDLAYMLAFFVISLRWDSVPRNVSMNLFVFRFVGFILFSTTGNRLFLLIFPNVFEFWFLFVAATKHWRPSYQLNYRKAGFWLLVCLSFKMIQEWILHGGRYLDQYVAVELLAEWWNWFVRLTIKL